MTTTLMSDVMPAWQPGPPVGHRNLTLVPLKQDPPQPRYQNYLLAFEAIEAGMLSVTEVSESGSVPELLAVNDADRPVLLIDGEELQGAKQNRIMNTSVLLPPKSRTKVPVSCVEEGRWSHTSRTFKSGNYSPSTLRGRKSRDVQENLRTEGKAAGDQGAVWASVGQQLDACHAAAPTRAMADAVATRQEDLEQYHEALSYPEGACGVVAAVSGRFVALDAFDSPATLEVIWPRLVASYAMDAESAQDSPGQPFSEKAAEMLLEHVAARTCDTFDAVALGRDLRFNAPDLLGQGLEVDNHLLHMSVFPPPDQNHGPRGPRIQPPSARNR
ncbi:MAG: ARPP-1 family domain-containing protein [Planctomycetota bacterium]